MITSDKSARDLFVQILGMDLRGATILVENGVASLEEVAYVPFAELAAIEGLQERELQPWRQRAREHLIREGLKGDDDIGESDAVIENPPPSPLPGGSSVTIGDDEKG